MAKKALLIGINDYKSIGDLRGCLNDVTNMRDILMTRYGFAPENISLLTDRSATKDLIRKRMKWLFLNARPDDHLVLHFSGHGSYIRDFDGDERASDLKDQVDELICLYDMDWRDPNSYFIDDELWDWTQNLPKGVNLTFVMDSCHSGDVTKQVVPPPGLRPPGTPETMGTVGRLSMTHPAAPMPPEASVSNFPPPGRFVAPPIDIEARIDRRHPVRKRRLLCERPGREINHMLLAGCQDVQTSADAYIAGSFNGAFTYYLCKAIRDHGSGLRYNELIGLVRSSLSFNGYSQIPQCEGPNQEQRIFGYSG